MTDFQFQYLRFLRMVADNPHTKHRGTEPTLPGRRTVLKKLEETFQKREVEREFYRTRMPND